MLARTNERSELCETVCRVAGTEICDFEGEEDINKTSFRRVGKTEWFPPYCLKKIMRI